MPAVGCDVGYDVSSGLCTSHAHTQRVLAKLPEDISALNLSLNPKTGTLSFVLHFLSSHPLFQQPLNSS